VTHYLTLEDITELASRFWRARISSSWWPMWVCCQSALARPQATVFGQDAYPALAGKAAALMESRARNPCLVDGDERIAWAATKLFLLFNDVHLRVIDVDDAEHYVVAVSEGKIDIKMSEATIQMWSTAVDPLR
jgi:death-on-curing protein